MRLLPTLLYYLPCLIFAVLDGSPVSYGKVSVLLAGRNFFFSALPILPNAAATARSNRSVTRLFGAWKSFGLQFYLYFPLTGPLILLLVNNRGAVCFPAF
jgi:hypothetical protein